jgi:hypothetical protein
MAPRITDAQRQSWLVRDRVERAASIVRTGHRIFDKRLRTHALRMQFSSREIYASYWTFSGSFPGCTPPCEDSHLFSLLLAIGSTDLVWSDAVAAGKRKGNAPDGDA